MPSAKSRSAENPALDADVGRFLYRGMKSCCRDSTDDVVPHACGTTDF